MSQAQNVLYGKSNQASKESFAQEKSHFRKTFQLMQIQLQIIPNETSSPEVEFSLNNKLRLVNTKI